MNNEFASGRRSRSITHSPHMKFHLNDNVPVYFNSTICVGLHSSSTLALLVLAGAVTVIRSDSDEGSMECGHLDKVKRKK